MRKTVYTDPYVSADHIADALELFRIVALLAVCAMGKSTSIKRALASMGNPPVMFVACRIVHALDGAVQFGLELYNKPDSPRDHPMRSTTINSLHLFDAWFEAHGSNGVIVLDELRSTLAVLNATHFKDHGNVVLLSKMMKKCRVIAADADLMYDGMCEHFLTSHGDEVKLLEYSHKPNKRTVEGVCGLAGEAHWDQVFQRRIAQGCNVFVHLNSTDKAASLAAFCKEHGVSFKLYVGGSSSDSKDDFKDADKALEGIQCVLTTATLTVAVDIQRWHCDHVMIHAGGGYGASPRDQRQAVERVGRKGFGDGEGQLSNPVMLTWFGAKTLDGESTMTAPTVSTEMLYTAKLIEVQWKTRTKRRRIDQDHDVATRSGTMNSPEWVDGVMAWQEVENLMYASYLLHTWKSMCQYRDWEFKYMRTGYDAPVDVETFDHGNQRTVATELSKKVNEVTMTCKKKYGDKYETAIDVAYHYFKSFKVIDKTAIRQFIVELKKRNAPECYLTEMANDLYLFDIETHGLLSKDQFVHLKTHGSQFHEQRSLRTKTLSELNCTDQNDGQSATFANLRHGRAYNLMRICRLLKLSVFELFADEGVCIDERLLPMFEKGYAFNDEFAVNVANPLRTWLKDWAGCCKGKVRIEPTAKENKGALQKGLEGLFQSYGINCKFERKQVTRRNAQDNRPRVLHSITVGGENDTTELVGMSLVKCDDYWIPFKDFQWPEEEEEELELVQFETIDAQGEHEELIDLAALLEIRNDLQTTVDRLGQEETRRDAASETARIKNLKKQKGKLTNLVNMILAVEEHQGCSKLKVTYGRRFAGVGRRYANGPSFQKAGSLIRATSKRYYHDIDMMNAHPVIAAFLVNQSADPVEYPALVKYGTASTVEREEILALVAQKWQCPRKIAKQLFCSLLNTGTVNSWQYKQGLLELPPVHRPPFVSAYEAESARFINHMAQERPQIVELSRDTEHEKAATRQDPDLYHRSRALNVAMQQLEDEMLQTMETCAEEDGWQYDCLIYDGALLRKRSDKTITDLNVLMRSTEFAIKEKHGIDISLVQKEL